jgi:hypothetical protein
MAADWIAAKQKVFIAGAMSLRDKWSGYLTTGIVAISSGITIYLLVSDSLRLSEIRRRKNLVAFTAENEIITSPIENAKARFGVLRVAGRFVNPFEEYL